MIETWAFSYVLADLWPVIFQLTPPPRKPFPPACSCHARSSSRRCG